MGVGNWLRRLLGTPSPEPLSVPASPEPLSVPSAALAVERMQPASDPRVEAAVEAMLRHPQTDQDQLLTLLEGCGFTAPEAWRAHQFLPIAFVHVVFRGRGVVFQSEYVLWDPDRDVRSTHRLADEPLYTAAVAAAEARAAIGCTPQQLLPVFGRSAEWQAIRQGGVVMTGPLLVSFEGHKAGRRSSSS